MPRQARIDIPGLLQHVIVRGIERRNIFAPMLTGAISLSGFRLCWKKLAPTASPGRWSPNTFICCCVPIASPLNNSCVGCWPASPSVSIDGTSVVVTFFRIAISRLWVAHFSTCHRHWSLRAEKRINNSISAFLATGIRFSSGHRQRRNSRNPACTEADSRFLAAELGKLLIEPATVPAKTWFRIFFKRTLRENRSIQTLRLSENFNPINHDILYAKSPPGDPGRAFPLCQDFWADKWDD